MKKILKSWPVALKKLRGLFILIGIVFLLVVAFIYNENTYGKYISCAEFESLNKCTHSITTTIKKKYIGTQRGRVNKEFHQNLSIYLSDDDALKLNLNSSSLEIIFGYLNTFDHANEVYASKSARYTVVLDKIIENNLLLKSEQKLDDGVTTHSYFLTSLVDKKMFSVCAAPFKNISKEHLNKIGCMVGYELKKGVWLSYVVNKNLFISDWESMNKKIVDHLNEISSNSFI